MAALALFALLVIILTLPDKSSATDVRVSISTPTKPVAVGGILAIQCQVWNIQDDYTVHIVRVLESGTQQITNGEYIMPTAERLDAYPAIRSFPGSSKVYFLTMVDVSNDDQGDYICKVFDMSLYSVITEDSTRIDIYSVPSNTYTLCSSTPNQPVTLRLHDSIILKCTSEKGVPTIRMKWFNTKTAQYIADRNRTDGHLVHSEAILRVDDSLQGATFSCEISSQGFRDWKRTCQIGPITVKLDNFFQGSSGITTHAFGNRGGTNEQGNILKPRLIGTCKTCTTSDDMLQFYLTIATIGTGFLTIVFLASTLILCYKYHHVSNETKRESARVFTPQQSIEPMYVSLQRRSINADREYMTLEDPNNPDNKIIVPKETFDDYCKTMTLKRV